MPSGVALFTFPSPVLQLMAAVTVSSSTVQLAGFASWRPIGKCACGLQIFKRFHAAYVDAVCNPFYSVNMVRAAW